MIALGAFLLAKARQRVRLCRLPFAGIGIFLTHRAFLIGSFHRAFRVTNAGGRIVARYVLRRSHAQKGHRQKEDGEHHADHSGQPLTPLHVQILHVRYPRFP